VASATRSSAGDARLGEAAAAHSAARSSLLVFATLAILWGAPYALIKIAVRDLSPEDVVFTRLLIGTLMLLPIAVARGAFTGLRGRIHLIVPLAAVQIAIPFLLITAGERHVSSSLAGVLVSTTPLFVALLAIFVDRAERTTGRRLGGLVVGIAGVGLLFGVDLGGGDPLLGGAMVTAAGFCYAVGTLLTKRWFTGTQPLGLAVSTLGTSSALLLVPAAVEHPSGTPTTEAIVAVVALGVFCTGLAFLCFYRLIADVGPARASLVAYVAPIVAVLIGVVFLSESLTLASVAGIALILAGSRLAAQR
jgi:drug/metabolite transporter (DMT)-like permease